MNDCKIDVGCSVMAGDSLGLVVVFDGMEYNEN